MENPIKMGWFGGTTIFGNIQLFFSGKMLKARRSSSLEAALSLDDEEFDGEADTQMAKKWRLWTGVTEDLLTGMFLQIGKNQPNVFFWAETRAVGLGLVSHLGKNPFISGQI